MIRRLLLGGAAFLSLGLTCGWGAPLDPVTTHCPPAMVDCGPGCVAADATCCDDTVGGGLSQCPTAGMGVGQTCTRRGTGTCPASGAGKYCCGGSSLAGQTPSRDIVETFSGGELGVFCGAAVFEGGEPCCSTSPEGKQICRQMSPRLPPPPGTGGGGGASSTGGGSGGGGGVAPSCSPATPGFLGSARYCAQLGTTCSCSSDSTNRCITKSEFDKAGKTYPGACLASGSSGCFDTATGTLTSPCCPGLTCKSSTVCGSTAAGGTCLQ